MAPLLEEAYIQTGKVYFVYKEFPVLGKQSVMASFAAQCAADQGKFWEMHDWLFQNKSRIRPDTLKQTARDLGLDGATFDTCFDNQTPQSRIKEDFDEGRRWGARGTPTFFINGRIIGGLLPKERFLQIVDAVLAEATSGELPDNVFVPTPTPEPNLDFGTETYAVMGNPDAPVTIVEFSDYQCPFCLRYFNNTLEKVKTNYVDTGKVFYVFKDFPSPRFILRHPKPRKPHNVPAIKASIGPCMIAFSRDNVPIGIRIPMQSVFSRVMRRNWDWIWTRSMHASIAANMPKKWLRTSKKASERV